MFLYVVHRCSLEFLGFLALLRQPILEKENSEFKPAVVHLKNWTCHILPVAETLGKYIYNNYVIYLSIYLSLYLSILEDKMQLRIVHKNVFDATQSQLV